MYRHLRLLTVLAGLLSVLLTGCSVTIEGGGMGRLIIDVFPMPSQVTGFTYSAKSDSGFGHTKTNLKIPISNGRAYVDVGTVAAGEWEIVITGRNAAFQPVYEHRITVWVTQNSETVVRVRDKRLGEQTEHGVFFDFGVQDRPLQRYIEEYEQFIVPDLFASTGLRPGADRPLIYLYGSRQLWDEESPCRATGGCYDPMLQEIHINARASNEVNGYALTEAYVHWLVGMEGKASLPYWLLTGFSRNESERIRRGDAHWDNPWLHQQWDEIQHSAVLVPALATYNRADAFTFTAVSHLLQTRGGKYVLHDFFQATKTGATFENAFRQAFGITTVQYQAAYEEVVERVRAR